jgi:hypothetical protein
MSQRLHDPLIKMVMRAIITGSDIDFPIADGEDADDIDDLQFRLDTGLIKEPSPGVYTPANLIYADVIVRTLTFRFQSSLPVTLSGRFAGAEGPDVNGLLHDFQTYWMANSDRLSNRFTYKECDAQFSLFGYMQKDFNGSVQVIMEFATGKGAVDICAITRKRSYPIELKMKSSGYSEKKAVGQLLCHMSTCRDAYEGWLVVFGRKSKKPWKDRLTWKTLHQPGGLKVNIVGC